MGSPLPKKEETEQELIELISNKNFFGVAELVDSLNLPKELRELCRYNNDNCSACRAQWTHIFPRRKNAGFSLIFPDAPAHLKLMDIRKPVIWHWQSFLHCVSGSLGRNQNSGGISGVCQTDAYPGHSVFIEPPSCSACCSAGRMAIHLWKPRAFIDAEIWNT